MTDFMEELEKDGDSILNEITLIETEQGKYYVVFPEDAEHPDQLEKIGHLFCQLLMSWILRVKENAEIMQAALLKKDKRIIPVTVMPKDLNKLKV